MRLDKLILRTVRLPLVAPFTTSFSTQTERTAVILELRTDGPGGSATGWAECVALNDPFYSSEYVAGAIDVIRRFLMPRLADEVTAETVGAKLAPVVGHRMAKAALEMAVLDAQLRVANTSFAAYLGVTRERVPCGVSVGIQDSVHELLDVVAGYLDAGYQRIKLKIRPGWDIEPVQAVRAEFGQIPLQVDANAAYTLADASHLRELDAFGLLLIEQPLAEDDLQQHAALSKLLRTPMCLDESIVSAAAAASAISMGAAAVINVKPGRVGGYLEARRIHDLSQAHGIAVWCGGMLETGIGRAANAALAALPGFTLVGDVSASNRFYQQDLTPPIEMRDGHIDVPRGPGLCTPPERELLEQFTVDRVEL